MYILELGGQDDAYAAAEAATATSDVSIIAPGLATATSINENRIQGLAYTHRASSIIDITHPELEEITRLLESTSINRTGTMAVRARNIRGNASLSTATVERELGGILTHKGFTIDLENPSHELRALLTADLCVLSWFVTVSVRDYGSRTPTERPFFHPGTLHPLEARSIVNLAHARPGRSIFDPMCGTGGFLLEAGLLGADIIGMDSQQKMVQGTQQNLCHYLSTSGSLFQGDAIRIPLCTEVDAVVVDVPYGRQSKITADSEDELLLGLLSQCIALTDRMVIVSDIPLESQAQKAGWSVEQRFDRPVHRSLTRYVHILQSISDD